MKSFASNDLLHEHADERVDEHVDGRVDEQVDDNQTFCSLSFFLAKGRTSFFDPLDFHKTLGTPGLNPHGSFGRCPLWIWVNVDSSDISPPTEQSWRREKSAPLTVQEQLII